VLTGRRLRGLPTGVELAGLSAAAAADRTLRAALGRPDLVDATGLVNRQRAVKSPRELELMRIAARILERVHARVREVVRPGIRENDLVAEIYHAAISGTPEHGGDYPAIVPLLASGADAAAPHLTWGDTPLVRGAATFLELGACHRRYHAVASRSLYVGDPPRTIRRAEHALIEALEVGIDVARAGNRAGDVAEAVDASLRRHGIDRRGARCGYPIGLGFPPDWGERTTSLRAGDPTVLEAGTTFHLMPGLWTDEWGLEITETILVRDDGPAECLADIPRPLVVVP
jgi:ectoine hydrolase